MRGCTWRGPVRLPCATHPYERKGFIGGSAGGLPRRRRWLVAHAPHNASRRGPSAAGWILLRQTLRGNRTVLTPPSQLVASRQLKAAARKLPGRTLCPTIPAPTQLQTFATEPGGTLPTP